MSFECCKAGFKWQGTPTGSVQKVNGLDVYVAHGSDPSRAILIVHDIFGWTLENARLLADTYAASTKATVYLPDFFHGEVIEPEMMEDPKKRATFDIGAFLGRNGKDVRGPEISSFVDAMKRDQGHSQIGAIGFCYGGWAVFQLGGAQKVDFISTAHPSLLTIEEIDANKVPVQVLSPEHDPQYTAELKDHTKSVFSKSKLDTEYLDFPGLTHGFAVRGDESDEKQKAGLEKAMRSFIDWSNKHFK